MSEEKPRILITGATGFTGMHACSYFTGQGYEVYGLARKRQEIDGCAQLLVCDLADILQIEAAVKTALPDYVLHLAGQNSVAGSWENPGSYLHANVLGTVNLLEVIRSHKPATRILVAGSMLQKPLTEPAAHPYSLSKTMQMLVAVAWEHLFQMNILLVKPCNLIGPGPSNGVCSIFAKKIAQMEMGVSACELTVDRLGSARDFLDVRDAVIAYGYLLESGLPGQIYELGTGKFMALKDVIREFKLLAQVQFEVIERNPASIDLHLNEQEYTTLNRMTEMGWAPSITLPQSLTDILDYQRLKQEESRIV